MAGASSSQFRFKDEDGWEDDTDQSESTYLNLDVVSIATALNCIPLYKRLELDKSLFTVSGSPMFVIGQAR